MGLFNRHKHTWKVLRVSHGTYVLFGGDATLIYRKCTECGQLDSVTTDGIWQLSDFK